MKNIVFVVLHKVWESYMHKSYMHLRRMLSCLRLTITALRRFKELYVICCLACHIISGMPYSSTQVKPSETMPQISSVSCMTCVVRSPMVILYSSRA